MVTYHAIVSHYRTPHLRGAEHPSSSALRHDNLPSRRVGRIPKQHVIPRRGSTWRGATPPSIAAETVCEVLVVPVVRRILLGGGGRGRWPRRRWEGIGGGRRWHARNRRHGGGFLGRPWWVRASERFHRSISGASRAIIWIKNRRKNLGGGRMAFGSLLSSFLSIPSVQSALPLVIDLLLESPLLFLLRGM